MRKKIHSLKEYARDVYYEEDPVSYGRYLGATGKKKESLRRELSTAKRRDEAEYRSDMKKLRGMKP